MSNYIGWFTTSIRPEESLQLLEKIEMSHGGNGVYERIATDEFACAAPFGYLSVNSKIAVVMSGTICWSDICQAKNKFDNSAKGVVDAYIKYGEDFIQYLCGAYSLVLIDGDRKRTILALDHIGQKSLYYGEANGGVVFGSSLRDVIMHPHITAQISHQSVFDYVYFHHCPSPGTIYKNIRKLEGGQYTVFENGRFQSKYYSHPEFKEKMEITENEMAENLRVVLKSSVKRLALNSTNTGAFLSGGLDSSTIAGLLAQVFPGEAKTCSIGFPVDGYDETEYARLAANHFDTRSYEYCLTPEDTLNAIQHIASFYDEPFGNSSAIPTYFCAKLAKDNGIKRLLAGDGGDELFAGNERYLKQELFEKYQYVPKPMRSVLEGMLSHAPEKLLTNKVLHKVKRYVEQASTPLPDRLQDYNFLHRHRASEVFTKDFLGDVNVSTPLSLLKGSYNRPENASALNRMLVMDWKTTLHDSDLVKVNKMCELAGVDVVYPMLDKSVVDLSVMIPSKTKTKNGKLRWFFKQTFSDFLPDEILNKSKHGFGLPFGIWMEEVAPLRELAYDSISDLAKRQYIKKDFLNHAINMHQTVHASYYGELIWILMMLEQWFITRKTPFVS